MVGAFLTFWRWFQLIKNRIIAGICILFGVVMLAIPFFYHIKGISDTERLLEDFTEAVEEKQDEETTGEKEEQTTLGEANAAIFSEGNVIAILEVEALGIRYPVLEGATADNLNKGIGHLKETAGIGEIGNCVLAGHNGSRHGEFFTHLSELAVGDTVTVMNAEGKVFTYVVSDSYTVGPCENSIKDQGEEKKLTLFTCSQKGTMRYVVRCLLKEAM